MGDTHGVGKVSSRWVSGKTSALAKDGARKGKTIPTIEHKEVQAPEGPASGAGRGKEGTDR